MFIFNNSKLAYVDVNKKEHDYMPIPAHVYLPDSLTLVFPQIVFLLLLLHTQSEQANQSILTTIRKLLYFKSTNNR